MRGAVDGLQLANRDLGIDLRGLQRDVAQQLLNEADVRPTFQHHGGAGVAKQVAAAAFADSCTIQALLGNGREPRQNEWRAVVGQEQRALNPAPPPAPGAPRADTSLARRRLVRRPGPCGLSCPCPGG